MYVNQVLIQNNQFTQMILSMKNSFNRTVGIITRVLSWRYSRVEARRKAESYFLDLAKPDKSQIQVIAKNFSINVQDNAVYIKTKPYIYPEGIVISNQYRLLDKEFHSQDDCA